MKADISKSLFLDLAFIIIAALVLLVKDPALILVKEAPEEEITIKALSVERPDSEVYEDVTLPGESLWVRIGVERAQVLLAGDKTDDIELNGLEQRLKEMSQEGDRMVVMQMEEGTNYETFIRWRNRLFEFKKQGLIKEVYEL
jgi:biopolymer transport protein ExbD